MLFTSVEYFLFLAGVWVINFILPHRWQLLLLLGASYGFYMVWRWEYGFFLLGVTVVNYVCGMRIAHAKSELVKRAWLTAAVLVSLAPLLFFKYADFLHDALRPLWAGGTDPVSRGLHLILPVGISFFTLQALGYSIDVSRGKCPAEAHFGRFALFMSFFPQLLAGPIARAGHLLEQFQRENHFDVARLSAGSKLIVWGLFKKVVIADSLAAYVNRVYDNPNLHSGSTLLLATYFFAFQIYCDFSGYSDIAIGSARILGYDLMQNFQLPYLATSIQDFWKRWHISLSTWFRDYVYISMGGNRVSTGRWAINITAVFLLSGLWHGANWTFVIWGGLHGCYYLLEVLWERTAKGLQRICALPKSVGWGLKVFITFQAVAFAWVFFRARTVSDAFLIVGRILTDLGGGLYRGPSQLETAVCVGLIATLLVIQFLQMKGLVVLGCGRAVLPRLVRWSGYLAMLYALVLLSKGSDKFIYFQF